MRALLTLLFILGACVMSEDASGQEKKEEKYPEKLTVRVWDKQGKKFLNPQEIDARRAEVKGETYFYIPNKQLGSNTTPVKGSEITDAKGVVWVSQSSASGSNTGESRIIATKKP